MAKKKVPQNIDVLTPEEYRQVVKEYGEELDKDPKYSLEVDPTDKYKMSAEQKQFVKTYCDVKNLVVACKMMNIEDEYGMQLLNLYSSQKEIARINMAMMHRRINSKMWDYERLGGYLTTLLTEENVPLSERLSPKDKLAVVDRLIDLNQKLTEVAQRPIDATTIDLDEQMKELSVDAIKALLTQDGKSEERRKLISQIKATSSLSMEEEEFLKTMDVKELIELLNRNGNGGIV